LRRIQTALMHNPLRISRCTGLVVFLALISLLGFVTPGQQQNSLNLAASYRPRAIVIGFMGGNVVPSDTIRNELIISDRLRISYPRGVYFEVFENRQIEAAHQKILQLLRASPGIVSSGEEEGKAAAQIILYGHSWGASAVVTLADELQSDGVPVTLTVQVDSIEKKGQHDAVIPANVARAVNFYQPDGMLHGRAQIRAANPVRTQILGNFRLSYKNVPAECSAYPLYERLLIKSHIAIECDPVLWKRIEGLIRDSLDRPSNETALPLN
jgi:hypothetical protein